jgi:hypothetical protein
MLAIVFGFCSAIALRAFEFGKEIAGLDRGIKEQLQQAHSENSALRARVEALTDERNKAQSVANTADTVLTAGSVAIDKLSDQNKLLALENQRLKSDLSFFEQLIPPSAANAGHIAIRGLQAEVLPTGEIKWQVLVIQGIKNPVEFEGQLELAFTGLSNTKPWTGGLPAGALTFKVKQYGRLEGVFQPPVQMILKSITAKVLQGQTVRAVQTARL